jgi:hypothetical protein
VSGIYRWVTPVGSYVGQSIDVHRRRAQEARGRSGCPKGLHEAFAVHGLALCTFEILEECAESVLDAREKHWIQTYRSYESGLNRTRGGQNGCTRASQEYAAKMRKQTWPRFRALYQSYFDTHGHMDVSYREPIIGTNMDSMRAKGSFRTEFDASFPGEFWESHHKRMWACEYKPRYRTHLDTHGHLDVPRNVPIIGQHMHDMRAKGCFRKEFDASFPGEFWESHDKRMWACEYKPRYRTHLDTHGHLDVSSKEPIIGSHMGNMRSLGCFKKEFDASFPGEFWESHHKRMWACEYKPRYRTHLDIHGHLDVSSKEPIIGNHMKCMRKRGSFRTEFDASFPGEFWESHHKRMWAKYKALYRTHLDIHGHLNVPYKEPIIGNHMHNMRAMGCFKKEFDLAFPGQFWKSSKVKS